MRSHTVFLVFAVVLAAILSAGCVNSGIPAQDQPGLTSTVSPPPVNSTPISSEALKAFVGKAREYAQVRGKEAALSGFQEKDGLFSQGNVYIYACDYNGTLLAHLYEADLVGTNRGNWTDVRGLPMIDIGAHTASSGGGFIAYLYPAPAGGIIDEKARDTYEPKIGYVSQVDTTWWIGSGIYFSDMVPEVSSRPDVISDMIGLVEGSAAYGNSILHFDIHGCEKGTEADLSEISNRSGRFVDPEGHYIYACDDNGTLLAHPFLPEKIGTSLIDHRDPFGMRTIRALSDTAHAGGGYIVFIWPNPDKGNREELKIGYVLPVDDTWWVGSGVYLNEITGTGVFFPSSVF